MIKSVKQAEQGQQEKFRIPRSVQQSIPIKQIYREGMWQVAGRYSRTWSFSDINYLVADEDDQEAMFKDYSALLNALSTDAITKITLTNRRMDARDFGNILLREKGDGLDRYREEYNRILTDKAESSNNLTQEMYITVSIPKKRNPDEARTFFNRVDNDFRRGFGRLSSKARELGNAERLRILHSFFRPDETQYYRFDEKDAIRTGQDFKDFICPDLLRFLPGHFELNGKVGRVLYMRSYGSSIEDCMITDLCSFPRNLILSLDILPVGRDEAIKELQNKLLGANTEITRAEQRQIANNSFSADIPYELSQIREGTKKFLQDITARDQRMMYGTLTLVHIADTLDQLNADTASLCAIAQNNRCDLGVLMMEQEMGLQTVLPYGLRCIHAKRTMTTAGIAGHMPFQVQEIRDSGGLYYGINTISRNLLLCDRKKLQNGHAFWLGVSGSGKSMGAKSELTLAALTTDDDILIVDPEREFVSLTKALGGEVITIEPGSSNHINALDMHSSYGEENPIIAKSTFLMSVFEQLMGADKLGPKHNSILDRCTGNVFAEYLRGVGPVPTLPDFRAELLRQPESEAQDMALAIELFSDGSLDLFAHETNVDMSRRIVDFDMLGLGDHLRPLGMLVMLNALENRVVENRQRGKFTRVYIDEVYLYFLYQFSAKVLYKFWKRLRKMGGMLTAITQNVEECLRNDTARLMFANSEFLVMLNQAPTDRAELSNLLHISSAQLSYITNADVGCGLIKVGGSIGPYTNQLPSNSELYKLMTTKPGEFYNDSNASRFGTH